VAWIELHQTLPANKKTMRLKKLLRIKTPQAVGHLCILWLWALDNAPNGDLSGFSADEIAEVSQWTGKNPDDFLSALTESGFVDGDLHLHDWYSYAGKLVDKRERNTERMRPARAEHVQGLPYLTVPYHILRRLRRKRAHARAYAHARVTTRVRDSTPLPSTLGTKAGSLKNRFRRISETSGIQHSSRPTSRISAFRPQLRPKVSVNGWKICLRM